MKVETELVKRVLNREIEDIRKVSEIMEALSMELASVEDEPKAPPVKKQYVIMLSDPTGRITPEFMQASGIEAFVGWVLQIPEEDSPAVAEERLIRGAYEFNITPKGRRLPARTIGEVCELVSTKILKEQRVWVKTKEPVLVVVTSNQVPSVPKEVASL